MENNDGKKVLRRVPSYPSIEDVLKKERAKSSNGSKMRRM